MRKTPITSSLSLQMSTLASIWQHIMADRRARFLQDASRALLVHSPAVSARLGLQSILHHEQQSGAKELTTTPCQSCGSQLIPSWSCTRISKSNIVPVKRRALSDGTIVYRCNKCGCLSSRKRSPRASRVHQRSHRPCPFDQAPSTQPPSSSMPYSSQTMKLSTSATAEVASTASNPRKRQKSRKNGGLSALVAQSKSQTGTSGLDLMDFIKSV